MIEASRVQTLLIQQNDEINRLRNRIEKLEAALRFIDEMCDCIDANYNCRKIARKALEGKDD